MKMILLNILNISIFLSFLTSYGFNIISEVENEVININNITQLNLNNETNQNDEPESTENNIQNKNKKFENELSDTQMNSINMLNYLSVLTQEINDSKGSRLFLENAYSSLINNIYPNAVDPRTQVQLTNILDTIEKYRMINVKRERLEYVFEQNRAMALRDAVPNPVGLLSVVQSDNILKAATSALYMAVDSYSSYSASISEIDMKYLKDGWELDDNESQELHNSRKQALNYMLSMVRENNIEGDYALNQDSVQDFVQWKHNTNVIRRIAWLESEESMKKYKNFGQYWLTLASSYFENEQYENCLHAIEEYEHITSRIFRKDFLYAEVLPMGIISAKECFQKEKYIEIATKYSSLILENTENSDWINHYFVAQVYLDLYRITLKQDYLLEAYRIAFNNVNNLVDKQKILNYQYLEEIILVKADKNASKREKKEIKDYNKLLKAERKTALPPVYEPFYLNVDLLFALADEIHISADEKLRIDAILHENENSIFISKYLDEKYKYNKKQEISLTNIGFDGSSIYIPISYITDSSVIKMTITNMNEEIHIEDWIIKNVERNKDNDYSKFVGQFTSNQVKKYDFSGGDSILIEIIPVKEDINNIIKLSYCAKPIKKFFFFKDVSFERV